jgi:hypothetical protein
MLAAGASAFAADLPSAESLLDRYVEVTGGKQAYDARKSEIMRGAVEVAAMGVKGELVRYAAEPDRYLITMDIPGVGRFVTGVKEGVAWELSDLMGPRIKSGLERAEALREATFNANAVWRELYPKVVTAGEESVDGEDCFKIIMTPPEGPPETLYLSKKTGLGIKMTTTASTQMGDVPAEILFSDYKNLGGILAPSRITERTAGQEIVITLQSVEVNPVIPESKFDLPSEVAALAARQAGK